MVIQQYRILRLVMVLAIVALTIFLYASYYANSDIQLPNRIHASAMIGEVTGVGNGIVPFNNKADENSRNSISTLEDLSKGNTSQQYVDEPALPSAQTIVGNQKTKDLPQSALTNVSSVPFAPSASDASANTNRQADHHNPLDTTKGIRTGEIYIPGHSQSSQSLCPNDGTLIKLLIMITSAPAHKDARLAIRQTWGHYGSRRDISIGFMLGATDNQTIEEALAMESYIYDDIVRGHFVDSYNNLTLKTISLLEWVDTNCPKVSFVLKTDDDMFINVPKLLEFIEKHSKDHRTIFGRLAKKWKPIRNTKSKYYVSPLQYFPSVFPQFTTGPAYLLSADVVHDLYTKSLNQTYLKLEDVFTTGIVAELTKVKRVHVNEFLNRRIAFNPCNIRKAISVHMVKSNEQFDLWKKLLDTNTKCK